MAKLSPVAFPQPVSPAIASYAYTDIAEGTGIVLFYGASNHANGTTDYILTTNTPYSSRIVVSGAQITADGTFGQIATQDYDITFNHPQNIKGTAYLNISIGGYSITTATGNKVWLSGAILQKYDGSTTTTLVAVSGAVVNITPANQVVSATQFLPLALTGTTHFKAGDTLRLSLDLWGYNGAGDLSHGGWGSDPADRNDPGAKTIADTDTTKLELYIPFLLNTV